MIVSLSTYHKFIPDLTDFSICESEKHNWAEEVNVSTWQVARLEGEVNINSFDQTDFAKGNSHDEDEGNARRDMGVPIISKEKNRCVFFVSHSLPFAWFVLLLANCTIFKPSFIKLNPIPWYSLFLYPDIPCFVLFCRATCTHSIIIQHGYGFSSLFRTVASSIWSQNNVELLFDISYSVGFCVKATFFSIA